MNASLPQQVVWVPDSEANFNKPRSDIQRVLSHFRDEIDVNSQILEIELLLLALAIGVQDAISFPDFHCFASNQTGNTVLFAVGALVNSSNKPGEEMPAFTLTTIGVSLGFFIMGVFSTGQAANYYNITRKRGWVVSSSVYQTIIIYIAAALSWHYSAKVGPDTTFGRIIVGLLAFSSGSQVAVVRGLKITDITTAMATAAYVDIFIDPKLTAKPWNNRGRNRRVVFLCMLVIGSFIGAGLSARVNTSLAILLSAIIKTFVTFLFLFNKEATNQDSSKII